MSQSAAVIDLFSWAPSAPKIVTPPVVQPPAPVSNNLSIAGLIAAYKSDPDSSYHKLRHETRENYDSLLRRLERDHGAVDVQDVKARSLLRWHRNWTGGTENSVGKKIAMGHALVAALRTIATFGATLLESPDCRALKILLHDMKFKMPKPRVTLMTLEQIVAVIAKANEMNQRSIAWAQAIQFECTFRQKDVIGKWVPLSEPVESDVVDEEDGTKWLRGIRWEEIDDDLVLHHITSKRQKLVEVPLAYAPLVIAEWSRIYPNLIERDERGEIVKVNRHLLPTRGPIVIHEKTGKAYVTHTFRRNWRIVATAAGIPKHIKEMDTRASAVTEAIESGAPLEDVRKTATHSNSSQTSHYSRGETKAIAKTMRTRAAGRRPANG